MPRPKVTTRPSEPPVDALLLYLKARDALMDGKRFSAITLLQRAIDLDPDSFELYMTLAQARQNPGGGDPRMIEALKQAATIQPDNLQAQAGLGRQYLADGDLDKAIYHLRLARQTPQYQDHADQAAAVDLFLARSLQQKGYTQAALQVYADLLQRLEHPDISIRDNPQLMMLASRPELIYLDVARLHEHLGQSDQALAAYEAAAERAPDDFELNARVVTLLSGMNRHKQAMNRALDLVSRFGGSAQSLQLLNTTYRQAGEANRVADDLQQLSQSHPKDKGLTLALAQTLSNRGDTARAEAMLIDAQRQNPDDPVFLQRLFQTYNHAGNVTAAAQLLIRYSAAHPAMQDVVEPLWQDLLRPGRKDRLTLTQLHKLEVPQEQQAAKLFWIARAADAAQRSAQARQALEQAVELSPPFAPAARAMLNVCWERDGWTAAQKAAAGDKLADLIKGKGDAALSNELRGINALRQNQLDAAAKALRQAIAAGDNDSDVQLTYGQVLLRQGKAGDYEQLVGNLIRNNGDDDDAWQALFQFYIQQNQTPRAVRLLGKWLGEHPDSARARLIQASVYLRTGQTDPAEKLLLKLVNDPQVQPMALGMLQDVYAKTGQVRKYVALLEELRKAQPVNLLILSQLVDVYNDLKQPDKAVSDLNAARAVAADDPGALYLLAHLYQTAGQKQTGEDLLQQALKIDPDYAPANNDLGYSWADEGKNLPQAEKMIRDAVKVDPDNTSFLDSLGWVLYKLGRFDEARAELTKAAVGENPDPVILNHLGDTLYRLAKKAEAAKLWQRSLDGIGKMPEPRDELKRLQGDLERKLGQFRQNQPVGVASSLADEATRT